MSVVRCARAWYIVCARGVAGVADGANPPRKRERRVVRGCGRGDFVHGRTRANEGSLMGAVVLVLVVDDGVRGQHHASPLEYEVRKVYVLTSLGLHQAAVELEEGVQHVRA